MLPNMRKLWVDDERDAPKGWIWVTTAKNAIRALEVRECDVVSLDHDLGPHGGTGYQIVLWMAQNECWPNQIAVHTHNPVGAKNMCGVINRYGHYNTECIWTPYGSYRHAETLGEWSWLSEGL